MKSLLVASLFPVVVEGAGAVFDYLKVQPNGKDIDYLNTDWDAQGDCNGYFQSPIDVPKKWVDADSALAGSEVVHAAYTYATNNAAVSLSGLAPPTYDVATMPTEHVVHSLARNSGYQMKLDLNQNIADADTANTKNFLTIPKSSGGNSIYDLLQVHWHFPSEHAVDGEYGVGEFHFVHQHRDYASADANELQYLVLGVMMEADATSTGDVSTTT
jgi:hypothetical protein